MSNYIFIDNLLWLIPLAAVLYGTYKFSVSTDDLLIDLYSSGFSDFSLDMFETNYGDNLKELSDQQPVMLVFLRHFGCTFCRESMQDIASLKQEIEAKGTKVIVVHMLEDEDSASLQLQKFGLDDIPTISDPECILYKMFKLKRGSFLQLFGPKVIFRGIIAGIIKGFGIGKEMGDLKQMPGVFLLYNGEIKKQFVHSSAADRPNYLEMATFE
ncbi:MAG: SelL-related redox protein [Chitinophagales bacterium]